MDKQQLKIEASTRLEELLTKAEAAKVVDGQIEATKLEGKGRCFISTACRC